MFRRRAAWMILAATALSSCSSGSVSTPTTPRASRTSQSAPASSPSPSPTFDTVTVGPVTLYICATCERAAQAAGIDLHAAVIDTVRRINAVLAPPTAYVDIADNPSGTIADEGVAGVSRGTDVSISLDSHFPDLRNAVSQWLPRVLAHELDETKRRDAFQAGASLKEWLITDGLADSVSIEIFPRGPLNPWDHALTAEQERQVWRTMQPHLREILAPPRDFTYWFLGAGGKVPVWAGYTVGYHIVQAYLARHPGATAVELTTVDTDRIVAGSEYRP